MHTRKLSLSLNVSQLTSVHGCFTLYNIVQSISVPLHIIYSGTGKYTCKEAAELLLCMQERERAA